VPFFPFTAKG